MRKQITQGHNISTDEWAREELHRKIMHVVSQARGERKKNGSFNLTNAIYEQDNPYPIKEREIVVN